MFSGCRYTDMFLTYNFWKMVPKKENPLDKNDD